MIKRILYFIFRDLFIIFGIGLIFLLVTEDIRPGFVSFWVDIYSILIIVGISGLLALITSLRRN